MHGRILSGQLHQQVDQRRLLEPVQGKSKLGLVRRCRLGFRWLRWLGGRGVERDQPDRNTRLAEVVLLPPRTGTVEVHQAAAVRQSHLILVGTADRGCDRIRRPAQIVNLVDIIKAPRVPGVPGLQPQISLIEPEHPHIQPSRPHA